MSDIWSPASLVSFAVEAERLYREGIMPADEAEQRRAFLLLATSAPQPDAVLRWDRQPGAPPLNYPTYEQKSPRLA